jgi:glyoxylase-like metal-dependent hydrolase (beta-lactamase superfamily II)
VTRRLATSVDISDRGLADSGGGATRLLFEGAGLTVHVVSDGVYRTDGGAMFGLVPKVLWERHVVPDAQNRVAMALNCLLVRDGNTTILVDTGYGGKLTDRDTGILDLAAGRPGLLAALASAGVAPEAVDIVVNTHLHADHCGGNTVARAGVVVPTFPNARYMVQRFEYAEAIFPNERTRATYLPGNLEPVADSGKWDLLDSDTQVTERLRTVVTRGHTQAHQCVVVEPPAAPPILFLGDVAPRSIHFERVAWVPAVDVLPLDSLGTKRRMAEWAIRHQAVCVFEHDPDVPAGTVERDGRHYRVTPVSFAAGP